MQVRRAHVALGLILALVMAAACGTSHSSDAESQTPPAPGGDTFGSLPGSSNAAPIIVEPANPSVVVTGRPTQVKFTAKSAGVVVPAVWSADNPSLGTMDGQGTFTAVGTVGGIATIVAQHGNQQASTTVTVTAKLEDNTGNVAAPEQNLLRGAANTDPQFGWLYPYDRTVFPRGLPAPVLQLGGGAGSALLVHAESKYLSYDGFYRGTNPTQITLSDLAWKAIESSAHGPDEVKLTVTKLAGGVASRSKPLTLRIAPGSLKGTVYYNSYSSALAGGGATLKVKVGQPAQVLFGGCTVCHTVSAQGNVLAASADHKYDASYNLSAGGAKMAQVGDNQFSFGALYPDGSMLLSCGQPGNRYPPNVPGMNRGLDTALWDTRTGQPIPATGLTVRKAITPTFSPDGKKVAFSPFDIGAGRSIAVMDFDANSKAFSQLVTVASSPAQYLAWPAFLPDAKKLVYQAGDRADFATWQQGHGNVMLADVASKQAMPLDALNGMAGSQAYLPYGAAEANLNYEPTVLPVAVGGYYWVVFTSRRFYGNTITEPNPWSDKRRKKLWVAAIDVNATPGQDPSHPAFYLPGQELAAGNMRGFWALDPCKQNGNTCESAADCCGGYCRETPGSDGGTARVCVPAPQGCAQEFEKCNTTADCCGAAQGYACLGGRCAMAGPR